MIFGGDDMELDARRFAFSDRGFYQAARKGNGVVCANANIVVADAYPNVPTCQLTGKRHCR